MSSVRRIGEIVDSISETHDFKKDKLIFLNTSDVLEGKILTHRYESVSTLKGQAKKSIKNGDILYSEIRPKNKRYAYVDVPNPEDYVVSTKLMVLRNKTEDVLTDYIYYFLTYDGTLDYLQMRAENRIGSFPQITFDIVDVLPLRVPELSEQRKIAAVLSALDAKIELNIRINRELEALAKTIYDYWFVQFDFPDENGRPYRSSGGKMTYNETLKRQIPDGWSDMKIGDLLERDDRARKIQTADILDSGEIPVIDQSTEYIAGYTNDQSSLIKADLPRIVFGDHTRIVKFINFDFARGADGTQILLSTSPRMPQHLFFQTISKIDLSNYGYARHFKFLKDISIIYPDQDRAKQFEEFAKSIFDQIRANIFQNRELARLRDWLLPMLMNGQVTVK